MEEKVLKVRMLGAFEMEYGEKKISFERNTVTKTNQLMQQLLFAGEAGVSREVLLQRLFGREEVTNPANSLRATVFRLRKLLAEAGLPQDEYIHIKSGIYRFTNVIPVKLDITRFEELYNQAFSQTQEEKRIELLEAASEVYQGDFLAQLHNEEWVANQIAYYKNKYIHCMNELCTLLMQRKEYQRLYQAAASVITLYPYEEWQVWQLDSLMAQNQMNEAMHLYEETEELLFRGMGVLPSARFKERLAKMNSVVEKKAERIDEIQYGLQENEVEKGAFYSSYPSFVESYRYMKRITERSGQQAYLMVCTITDGKGYPLESSDRLHKLSREVADAIKNALRRGDLYTKYSENQFLVLLLDIKQADCVSVIDRINGQFENPSRKNYLKYHVAPINDVENKENT